MSEIAQTPPLLESGPQPLTPREGRWWAVILVGIGLLLAVVLPAAALWVAAQAVPPGSVVFGSASVIPASGWAVDSRTEDSVTLTQGGVVATFEAVDSSVNNAARLELLTDLLQDANPDLRVASDPRQFGTPTGDSGLLRAVAGVDRTAVIATVVRRSTAVDMTAIGESRAVASLSGDLETMVRSIRLRGPAGPETAP